MEHFYDGQIKRYLNQFMRLMSNFAYKDSKGNIVRIPVRFGDMSRQVAQILNKNSENVVQSAPFIACYIKGLDFARDRLQDPTYVSKVNIRERAYDEQGQEYLNVQGANYTVERLMPTPFNLQFTADIWTTNIDQKLQLLEQLLVLFNPSMEIQTNNNYIDWTSLSLVELTDMKFSSRSIPQGLEQDIDIATLNFTSPIWITTPAKVKKLGIITKIVTSIFDTPENPLGIGDDSWMETRISVGYTTLGNYGVLIFNNTAKLMHQGEHAPQDISDVTGGNLVDQNLELSNSDPSRLGQPVSWNRILDAYPGRFVANLSQIRLTKPDGGEIVGSLLLDPVDDTIMRIDFSYPDPDTLPSNTLISDLTTTISRGTVEAIINPETFNPRDPNRSGADTEPAADTRYLILEDVATTADGPQAWKNQDGSDFTARANDIIQWDGAQWNVLFNSSEATELTYITNSRTNMQYSWDGTSWMKSYEGVYSAGQWRLVL
jgi:hypothetical protein